MKQRKTKGNLHHTDLMGLVHRWLTYNQLYNISTLRKGRKKYISDFAQYARPFMSAASSDLTMPGKLEASCEELIDKVISGKIKINQDKTIVNESESVGAFVQKGSGETAHYEPGEIDHIARVANDIGFRKVKNQEGYDWCILQNNRITKLKPDHANSLFASLMKPITDKCEGTRGFHARFSQLLSKPVLLSDNLVVISRFHASTASVGYLYFNNVVVEVGEKSVKRIPWSKLSLPVWEDKVIKHDLLNRNPKKKQLFKDFIKNLQNDEVHSEVYFKSVIGYLLHNFRRADDDQMVVIIGNQRVKKGDNKGGAGKSLVARSFEHLVAQAYVGGETMDLKGNKFTWHGVKPGTQQIFIDELQQGSLKMLKSMMSTSMTVKPFMEAPFVIEKANLPKLVVTMAEIPDFTDEGVGRRLIPLVLSDFYYKKVKGGDRHPVKTTHGKWFFSSSFNKNDWNAFMWFMIDCLRSYLKNDVNPKSVIEALRPRLVSQEFQDDLMIQEIQKIIDSYNKTFFMSDLYEFKQPDQKENSFTHVVKKMVSKLGYTVTEKMVKVTLGNDGRVVAGGGPQTRRQYKLVVA